MTKIDNQIIGMEFNSIEKLFKLIDNVEEENTHLLENNQKNILDALNDSTYKFYTLTFALKRNFSFDKKLYFTSGLLTAVANNCFVIKKLFGSGWHLQSQILMRAQFEHLNTLIAFLSNEGFYNRVSNPINGQELISPKKTQTEKIIKKLVLSDTKDNELWTSLKQSMDYLYSEFSKVAHGNLFHVSIGSSQESENEHLTLGLGGTGKPLKRFEILSIEMNNYTQYIWLYIKKQLLELGIIVSNEDNSNSKYFYKPFILNYDLNKLSTESN